MNSMSRELDPGAANDLLARQAALQRQAGEVLADLDLVNLLTIVGQPMLVGSAMTGLMVWQDIDVIVLCPRLDPGRIWDAVRPLTSHPCVKKLRWSNVRGPFNLTGRPEIEGYYFCVHYHQKAMAEWKIDCWFFPNPDHPRPELELMDRLSQDLTEESRLAILRIKDAWYGHPDYRHAVCSVDIYTAVLDHGIRTPGQFAEWLRTQRGE